ncbi:MAG: hypothetical protein ACI4II_00595 [Acutalibacteraceae bacterium]
MKNKKVKIILSVFVGIIIVAAAVIGIKYSLYISEMNKAMNEKFGIENCTDIVYIDSLMNKRELSLKQEKDVWDFMLNKIEKYEISQAQIDDHLLRFGGFHLQLGDYSFGFYDGMKRDGKTYSIYYLTSKTDGKTQYYIVDLLASQQFNMIFDTFNKSFKVE